MRVRVFAFVLLLLVAGCGRGDVARSGNGVETVLLNYPEVSQSYFRYYDDGIATDPQGNLDLFDDPTMSYLFDIQTLVHNRGYSHALAAMYITGYDPNLFVVVPKGFYSMRTGQRACWLDVQISTGGGWSPQLVCDLGSTTMTAGGSFDGGSLSQADLDFWNVDFASVADEFFSFVSGDDVTIVQDALGAFGGNFGCTFGADGSDVDTEIGPFGAQFGSNIAICTADWLIPGGIYLSRSSRGILLLSLYSGVMKDCQNRCVLVPSLVSPDPFLAGNTPEYPDGMAKYVDYAVFLRKDRWPSNLNDHDQLFQISTCYLYTTYANPMVCIDPTPGYQDGEACTGGGLIDVRLAQRAPIQITTIEQKGAGPRIAFTIRVQDVGGGRLFDPGAIDMCSPAQSSVLSRQLLDTARVVDARILGEARPMDCRDGVIHFRNGVGEITCFYDTPPIAWETGAYQTQMNIEIGYLYRDTQTFTSHITRV